MTPFVCPDVADDALRAERAAAAADAPATGVGTSSFHETRAAAALPISEESVAPSAHDSPQSIDLPVSFSGPVPAYVASAYA